MDAQEIQEVCSRQAIIDLRSALAIFGIGEATGYRMAKHAPEKLPFKVLRVGHIYKVPTVGILAALGLSPLDPKDRQLTA